MSTVNYNRFSFDSADHSEVASSSDVLISGDLEIDGTVFVDGGYGCGCYVLANFCPAGNTDGRTCDDVPAGTYCESDSECMLPEVNNCGIYEWWFKRLN